MKKRIGLVALSVFGFVIASALAQIPAAPVAPVAAPVAAAVEAPVAAAAAAVAAVTAPAGEITVKGKVSVVPAPDGTVKLIFINPSEPGSHGYKVDLVNGEGKTLADKHGKIVEATGVDANRLFTIATVTVIE